MMLTSSNYSLNRKIRNFQPGASILIFGGTGSLGTALIKRFISMDMKIIAFSRDEGKHWNLKQMFKDSLSKKLSFIVGDVRDKSAVINALRVTKPQHVIIASALKQVDTCEMQPTEAIATNVSGIQNIVDAIDSLQLDCNTCFVSTDKACSPINVYGMCKALGEKIVAAPSQSRKFIVRYGNVLDSRGSVIPLFQHQAKNSKEFTLTHSDMTRFLMTLDESVDLIIDAIADANHGEIWIPELNSMKILDLANIFAERYGKKCVETGIRPGEKLHELLINDVELLRKVDVVGESGNKRFVIKPASECIIFDVPEAASYSSADNVLSHSALRDYLDTLKMINI